MNSAQRYSTWQINSIDITVGECCELFSTCDVLGCNNLVGVNYSVLSSLQTFRRQLKTHLFQLIYKHSPDVLTVRLMSLQWSLQ